MFGANNIWPLVGAPSGCAEQKLELRVNYEKAICSSNFERRQTAAVRTHGKKAIKSARVCISAGPASSFCVESKLFILLTANRLHHGRGKIISGRHTFISYSLRQRNKFFVL
jgi:hypothetical protein